MTDTLPTKPMLTPEEVMQEPKRSGNDWRSAKPGICECGAYDLIADGMCAECWDATFLSEWRSYARSLAQTCLALFAQAEAQAAEVERLRGRVIAEQDREIARIEAEIAVLADEFGKVAPKAHWACLQSLGKLIDALYDQKNDIKRVADWRAIADQDRRQALAECRAEQPDKE